NAERYITPELKEKEQIILEAEEKSVELEYQLFMAIREQIKEQIPLLQRIADVISQIDVLQSFATVSEANNYVRPNFVEGNLKLSNRDRKSTRLNSSHVSISYAVFCLKKKKKIMI